MRGTHVVTTYLVAVLAAGLGGFFLGANYNRLHTPKPVVAKADNSTVTPTSTPASADSTSQSPAAATPASTDQTYIVKHGDTLFSIGKQFNLTWPVLAAANNLTETTPLKEGQVLTIPSAAQANTIQTKSVDIKQTDEEKQNLQSAQDYANAGTGQLAYRLVPTQVVAQSPLLSQFQFTKSDLYIEKSKDLTAGTATVEVTHLGKVYTVSLTQPLTKGEKGVWTPTKVTY